VVSNTKKSRGVQHILLRDYETRSVLSLPDVGTWRYTTHPSTDVLCCAYAIDDGEVKLWVPGDPVPPEFIEAASNPNWIVSAFNDTFERLIETYIMGPRHGWPVTEIARHRCLMASSLSLALPGSLEKVAIALGLEQQKDDAGKRNMQIVTRPRKPHKGEAPGIYWNDDPGRLQRLYSYCKQDVENRAGPL
jgi:DNA polymerase